MVRALVGVFLVALLTSACSSGGGGTGTTSTGGGGGTGGGSGGAQPSGALTCAWLEGPDNCWQAAVDQAHAECGVTEQGYFGPEYLSCAYPNGDSDVYTKGDFHVEATRGGNSCFVFDAPTAGQAEGKPVTITFTTSLGTVVSTAAIDQMTIQCPDGESHTASGLGMIQLFSCKLREYSDGSSVPPWPGYAFSQSHLTVFPPPLPEVETKLTNCTCAPAEPPEDGGIPPPDPGCPAI